MFIFYYRLFKIFEFQFNENSWFMDHEWSWRCSWRIRIVSMMTREHLNWVSMASRPMREFCTNGFLDFGGVTLTGHSGQPDDRPRSNKVVLLQLEHVLSDEIGLIAVRPLHPSLISAYFLALFLVVLAITTSLIQQIRLVFRFPVRLCDGGILDICLFVYCFLFVWYWPRYSVYKMKHSREN